MIVLVKLLVDLLVYDIICAVISVDRINNPPFNPAEQCVRFAVVEFTFEIRVLQKIFRKLAVGLNVCASPSLL